MDFNKSEQILAQRIAHFTKKYAPIDKYDASEFAADLNNICMTAMQLGQLPYVREFKAMQDTALNKYAMFPLAPTMEKK